MGYVLTLLRFKLTKGIFACKRLTDISLCTVDKWSLLFRCSESVILQKSEGEGKNTYVLKPYAQGFDPQAVFVVHSLPV